MNSKNLSICIPTYNRAKILDKTLFHIVSQNISHVEIIVSDNASVDETEEIVEKYKKYGIKYYKNTENYGVVYNFLKVLELTTSEYVTLLSDEDDINIENILFSINELSSSKVGVILGGIITQNNYRYRSYKTKIRAINFITFFSFGFSVAYVSGIVFLRKNIDFIDLWREFNSSSSYGLLDIYPHVYIFNKIILGHDLATDKRTFVSLRDKGENHISDLGAFSFVTPQGRFSQLEKNLVFIESHTSFIGVERALIKYKLISDFKRGVISYLNLDSETRDYYQIERSEIIDLRVFIFYSMNKLKAQKLIHFYDDWLLFLFVLVRFFYSHVISGLLKIRGIFKL